METVNHIYQSFTELEQFIKGKNLSECDHILIQVFSGLPDEQFLTELVKQIRNLLPNAAIAGATTDGEIGDGQISTGDTVLSFSTFEKSTVKTAMLVQEEDSFRLGEKLATELVSDETKGLILFGNSVRLDSDDFLKGVESVAKHIPLAGGIAAENGGYSRTFVLSDQGVSSRGVVGVSLNGEQLRVSAFYNHNWFRIGKSFKITEARGNRVYSINGRPAIELYKKYFGPLVSEKITRDVLGFPLVVRRGSKEYAAFLRKVHEDGSITMNDPLYENERVQFSYGNVSSIMDRTTEIANDMQGEAIESIFVYSCLIRRRFLQNIAQSEIAVLHKVAPTTGFFSYGELYGDGTGLRSMSRTMTMLAISENQDAYRRKVEGISYEIPDDFRSFVSVSNFLHAVTEEMGDIYADLEESEQMYRSLFLHNTDVVYSTDLNGAFISVNKAFENLIGYKKEDVLHKNSLSFISEKDIPMVRKHFYNALEGKVQYYELKIKSKQGTEKLFQIKNVPIIINGEKTGVYGIGRDITEKRRAEKQLEYLAFHDSATGLPNRDFFVEHMNTHLRYAKQHNRMMALAFLDLDHFKLINDSLGHSAGDEVIKQIINKLQELMPEDAFLARFGGDEFTILIPDVQTLDALVETLQVILHKLTEPFLYEEKEFFITSSIGISMYPDDGYDSSTLLKNAHTAMYQAKKQGRNRIKFYAAEMNEQALYRLELESYLRKALEKDEFFICYQPLIDAEKNEIFGSEALIRWNHPRLGMVSPDEFIPLAEETGLIEGIGKWVLKTACAQNKKWQKEGSDDLMISVNVSARQFQKPDFVDEVREALLFSGLEPRYLNLELTESTMLRNIKYSIEIMKELREMGVRVSIDDFGTGYSSLSYLKHLPIDMIKIDRSFIKNMVNESDVAIVKAIITMGHGLSVRVLAEGVERKEQIDALREMKCHYLQGYFFNRPIPADLFELEMKGQNKLIL